MAQLAGAVAHLSIVTLVALAGPGEGSAAGVAGKRSPAGSASRVAGERGPRAGDGPARS
jgi:hypothetical protein